MLNNQSKIQRIIENSTKRQAEQQKEFYLFGKWFYVKDPFITPIDVKSVIQELENKIPSSLFEEVDEIFVGEFDFLIDKGLEALFKDGAIYITNFISTEVDLVENIMHEIGHSLESRYGRIIYGDQLLAKEFLGKRNSLKSRMNQQGYDTNAGFGEPLNFQEIEYNKGFDEWLFRGVGYEKLNPLLVGIFPSPYAVTSLREYWSVGFEDYFVGDREYLKRVSPILFSKIEEVIADEY
jgi:hypothetical protein